VEVFEDERTVTTGHGPTAGAARYLAIDALASCLARLDDLVKGTAVRTRKEGEAPRHTHDNPPAARGLGRAADPSPDSPSARPRGPQIEATTMSVASIRLLAVLFCGGATALR